MKRRYVALVRLSEDLEVTFTLDDGTNSGKIDEVKEIFDSEFGIKISPESFDHVKIETVKRTHNDSIVYPVIDDSYKGWFDQQVLSVIEEGNVVTVGELIKQLQKLDPDMPVETQNRDDGGDYSGSTPLNDMGKPNDEWIQSCVENGKLVLS